ncbi:MAG: amidohydrolase family protein, partial [Acidimicrobiales bacterium]|nr:amidohydrolase family protein [Acidimicrobiales bacterium]
MASVSEIKAQIDHPVIDADGHLIEFVPVVRELLEAEAGADVVARFDQLINGSTLIRGIDTDDRRALGLSRTSWWGLPAANTLDRATAMLPALQYERLDELGLDVALLYPTYGLTVTAHPDHELRPAMARAFNQYAAAAYAPYADRLVPVATIPMYTPDEAIAELHHAVGELGMKAVMMAGVVARPVPGLDHRGARYMNGVGHDSEFDYDPVWQTCVDLGVVPTFHAAGMGWGSRTSRTNYVYNHIGNFAAAGEAACRSILFGGAAKRFPTLRFAFQEGGVAWGQNLLADTLGHYEKRNRDAIEHYNPARLDRSLLAELVSKHGDARVAGHLDRLDEALFMLSDPEEDLATLDEFAEAGIESAADIVAIFANQFFFGCEADDPMNAMAFDDSYTGTKLPAVFASDIGHWDVPDITEVLPEAWELVEDGHLTT